MLYELLQYILWQMRSLKSYFKSVKEVKTGLQILRRALGECFLARLAIQN